MPDSFLKKIPKFVKINFGTSKVHKFLDLNQINLICPTINSKNKFSYSKFDLRYSQTRFSRTETDQICLL